MESVNSSLDVAITHASDNRDQPVASETDKGQSLLLLLTITMSMCVAVGVEMHSKSDGISTKERGPGPKHSLSGESTTSPTHLSDASLRLDRDLTSVERPTKQRKMESMSAPRLDSHASARHEHPHPPRSPSKQQNVDPPTKKRRQLLLYVKHILDPYFAAGLIEKETYKRIVGKVVDKVLATHKKEETADFIRSAGMRIRSLIEEYIRYYKERK